MTFNPNLQNRFEGAKVASWIVKFNSYSIFYWSGGLSNPPSSLSYYLEFDSIETLKNPFQDNISIGSGLGGTKKLFLPEGKYWLNLRLGLLSGTGTYNFSYYFSQGISGYVNSLSDEKWMALGTSSYLKESTSRANCRYLQTYYESTGSDCYIRCWVSRGWSNWYPGGTPTVNHDGSSSFGTSTSFPYGASRLLVMRLE